MTPTFLDSLKFNALLRSYRRIRHTWLESLWWRFYRPLRDSARPVRTRLHGYPVVLNSGYPYPLTIRSYPSFNAPLLEVIHTAARVRNRPIRFVDVGAAMGDTVLLVEANCPGMVAEYICIDGDQELYSCLQANLEPIATKKLIFAQLSRCGEPLPDLVRIRPDCIASQGERMVPTQTLEQVLEREEVGPVDVLKIDIEGYDAEVLLGCESRLGRDLPIILCEWHPILCQKVGTTCMEHFSMLQRLGYSTLVWFNKLGEFSHFSSPGEIRNQERLAEYCLQSKVRDDWHYDVVALPPGLDSEWRAIAELGFASQRRSWA